MNARARLEQGLALQRAGQTAEAERTYRAVLADHPDNADAHHFLGLIAHVAGRAEEAERFILRAIALDEPRPTFHFNLGALRFAQGELRPALDAYSRATALDPQRATAHVQRGNILGMLDRLTEAEEAFRAALAADPKLAEALVGLGAILRRAGRSPDAIALCRQAIALKPDLAAAWANLGSALERDGELIEAQRAYREAVHLSLRSGQPDWNLSSLYNLVYATDEMGESLHAAHTAWGALIPPAPAVPFVQSRASERRLRVGYVSADFRAHSCAHFLEPLFAAHSQDAVEVFAYANVAREDETTARLRALLPNPTGAASTAPAPHRPPQWCAPMPSTFWSI